MKRIISVILILALLCGSALAGALTREEAYREGINALYDESAEGYEIAGAFFADAGGYGNAKYFVMYTEALLILSKGDAGADELERAGIQLTTLGRNARFIAELEENGLPTCEDLLRYVEARKYEAEGNTLQALVIYRELFVLDALWRCVELEEEFAKHEHVWSEATCEKPRVCTLCGIEDEGSALEHDWKNATCTNPRTCARCGKTEDKELGHSWKPATCESPKTCIRCAATEDSALNHSWKPATCEAPKTCTRCGKTEGEALAHVYAAATYEAPETCVMCGAQRGEKLEYQYQAGDYITFGSYPQTTAGNDAMPIEWQILEIQGDRALIISRYALDCVQYNTAYTNVTWETCSLRKWLNSDFYNKAFSADEKQEIVLSKVTADKNLNYSTNPGNDTLDNVFLLSIPEVNRYFKDNASRRCVPTDYAIKNGAYTSNGYTVDGRACCWWWLRSPGYYRSRAACVDYDGSVYDLGYSVNGSNGCVRPCVWVRLF